MRTPTRPALLAFLLVAPMALGAGACGGSDEQERPQAADPPPATTEPDEPGGKMPTIRDGTLARRPPGEEGLRVAARQARIVAKDSAFGRVLFDANGQVVYVFENDRPKRSNCTSEDCVKAWPPVLTRERPSAGAGVDARRLGTIRRDDGSRHVTYNGRPLYFYEHEAPGEIKCHNVELHGGLWWVVTPLGEPAD